MWWHFRDHCIVASDWKIAALHFADYSSRFLAPLCGMNVRHEFYLIGRPSALNAGSITVPSSVRVSP
jgi:hypothetical protein